MPVGVDIVDAKGADANTLSHKGSRSIRRGLTGMLVACSALLAGSCGTADQSSAPAAIPAERAAVLVDLRDRATVARWSTLDDPVMGGMSTSGITSSDVGLVFSGDISLANDGGFASARSPQDPGIGRRATGAKSLRVHARGDGKTYLVKVGITGQSWSYVQRFPTAAGVQRGYDLPVEDFQPVGQRLRPDPDAPRRLAPSSINRVAIYILDGQEGPFELTVSAIDAAV